MQLFEGYTADELHRVLVTSRWIAGLLLLLAVAAFVLNQWLLQRIAAQQKIEHEAGKSRLVAAENELSRLRSLKNTVPSTVEKMTSSRKLSAIQVSELKSQLATAVKGKVIITYLTVEWDAEDLAKHLAKILEEAGYRVAVSDHLWVKLEYKGLSLTSLDGNLSEHARALQTAFQNIGLEVPTVPPGDIAKELEIKPGDAVLIVSSQ